MARIPTLSPLALLENTLSHTGLRWHWALLPAPPEPPVPGEVFRFDTGLKPKELACIDIPGADLVLHVECGAWQATAFDTAAFPDEVERLREDCPAYPAARVVLPPLPDAPPAPGFQVTDLAEDVGILAHDLEALGRHANDCAAWLRETLSRIDEASERTRREGEFFRRTIKTSSFNEWHISGCDQHAGTVRVIGRDLHLSSRPPTGMASDLDTFHLHALLEPLWRTSWAPPLRVEAADYGTRRVRIAVGRGSTAAKYWVDLAGPTISKQGQDRKGRAGGRPARPRLTDAQE